MHRLPLRAAVLLVAIVAPRPAAAQRWDLDTAFGYGRSHAVAGARAGASGAHLVHLRLRVARFFGARELGVAAELLAPLGPLPYGQLGAGLGIVTRLPLTAPRLLEAAGPGPEISSRVVLHGSLAGGWLYAVSGLDEGYIAIDDAPLSFHGPYGRLELGPLWELGIRRAGRRRFAVGLGIVAGTAAVHARYRYPAAAPAAWRLTIDGALTVALGW